MHTCTRKKFQLKHVRKPLISKQFASSKPQSEESCYTPVTQHSRTRNFDSPRNDSRKSEYIPVSPGQARQNFDKGSENPYQAKKRRLDDQESCQSSYQPVRKNSNRAGERSHSYQKKSNFEENPYQPVKHL